MSLIQSSLVDKINQLFQRIQDIEFPAEAPISLEETGKVIRISNGIVLVNGLPGAGFGEILLFPGKVLGIVFDLDIVEIGVVLLGNHQNLQVGDEVKRTMAVADIPVGDQLLGRIISPLGEVLDGKGNLKFTERFPIERPATDILDRAPINKPLATGIKIIDVLIPIGRGQRELLVGDRQTGKTAVAIDTILNQKGQNVKCIYCAIGQRASSLARVVAKLEMSGAMEYTSVIATDGDDPAGLIYIAPYAATSIAEYFMERGEDVLIVYDDLTNHARAYREISLLLKRPPGREAFPGDIFYIHSRLLERSTHLIEEKGGGSLTALPIIETEAQNISAYIPTNLISITDGQIFFSQKLFELGFLPAIDIGKSVSRVGGKAQLPLFKDISGNLKLAFSQFEELETFARYGTHLDDHTQKVLNYGQRIREILKQPQYETLSMIQQIAILIALTKGFFNKLELSAVREIATLICDEIHEWEEDLQNQLLTSSTLSEKHEKCLFELINQCVEKHVNTSLKIHRLEEN